MSSSLTPFSGEAWWGRTHASPRGSPVYSGLVQGLPLVRRAEGGSSGGRAGGGGPPREDGQGLGTQPLLSACSPFLQLWEESLFQPRPGKDVGARGVPLESAPL